MEKNALKKTKSNRPALQLCLGCNPQQQQDGDRLSEQQGAREDTDCTDFEQSNTALLVGGISLITPRLWCCHVAHHLNCHTLLPWPQLVG